MSLSTEILKPRCSRRQTYSQTHANPTHSIRGTDAAWHRHVVLRPRHHTQCCCQWSDLQEWSLTLGEILNKTNYNLLQFPCSLHSWNIQCALKLQNIFGAYIYKVWNQFIDLNYKVIFLSAWLVSGKVLRYTGLSECRMVGMPWSYPQMPVVPPFYHCDILTPPQNALWRGSTVPPLTTVIPESLPLHGDHN